MNKLFHYDVINLLALTAGFNQTESHIIATASQYVDDAIEDKPIQLNNIPTNLDGIRIKKGEFDPICTAHSGVESVLGSLFANFPNIDNVIHDIFEKTYIPFHFLPEKNGSLITTPDCLLGQEIVKTAVTELSNPPVNRECSLIKLGIALHSYADTWAHQDFSGTLTQNNVVDKINIYSSPKKNYDIMSIAAGHLNIGCLADETDAQFEFYQNGVKLQRNNIFSFINASESIYNILSKINNNRTDFDDVSYQNQNLREILRDTFKNNKLATVLNTHYVAHDVSTKTPHIHYYYFHREALIQRNYILSKTNITQKTVDYKLAIKNIIPIIN